MHRRRNLKSFSDTLHHFKLNQNIADSWHCLHPQANLTCWARLTDPSGFTLTQKQIPVLESAFLIKIGTTGNVHEMLRHSTPLQPAITFNLLYTKFRAYHLQSDKDKLNS
jgi:hypothetical protein